MLATAGLVATGAPAASAAPATPTFPAAIDDYAEYAAQRTCDPTAKPGVTGVKDLLQTTYGSHDWGIGRDCGAGDTSEHKEGRALDYHFNYYNSAERADAQDFLAWLLATDQHGNRHANARRLGVMYIIWNHQIWSSYRANDGWRSYQGSNPHTDHIHLSFSWAGARKQTSWWGAAPGVPALPADNVGRSGLAFNKALHLMAQGTDNNLQHHMYSPANGWTPVRSAGGPIASRPSVIPHLDNSMGIFARGTDNAVKYRFLSASTGWDAGWRSVPGAIDGAPATARIDGTLFVLARVGTEVRYRYLNSSGWNSDGVWRGLSSPTGVQIVSDPVAAVFKGRMYVLARGSDNQIWVRIFYPDGNPAWGGWFVLPGAVTDTPAVASRDDSLFVFARTSSGEVRYHTYTEGAPSWVTYRALYGNIVGSPSAITTPDNTVHVQARTATGEIVYRYIGENGWNDNTTDPTRWRPLGKPTGVTLDSGPVAVNYGSALYVTGQGSDGNLHTRSIDADGWTSWEQLTGSHAPIG